MSLGFGPLGSRPLGALPTYRRAHDAIESADWTGIERRLAADPAAVERIQSLVRELDAAIDDAELTNAEKAKAKALTGAIVSLAHSPEPEWKVVGRLLITLLDSKAVNASLNAVVIGGVIISTLKVIGVL